MKPSLSSFFFTLSLSLSLFIAGCTKNLTVVNVVYDNDFSKGELDRINVSGWNNGLFGAVSNPRITQYNGNSVLGYLNNNIVRLELNELPMHDIIRIEVELFLHNDWKNDLWKMECDGETRILTGFSNDPLIQQAYPNWLGNGSTTSAAGANAQQTGLPGICNTGATKKGTSRYAFVQTFAHSQNQFLLQLSDAGGNVNDTCTRGWSVNRLTISTYHN